MAEGPRSVKIDADERGGWSSERPRSGPERPPDIATRNKVLKPSDRVRYTPGSLVMIVSPSPVERDGFVARRIEDKGSVLSLARVRELLAGRVGEDAIEAKAAELLDAAVRKRLEEKLTVVIPAEGTSPEERERWARAAAENKRSAHLILLDIGAKEASEEDRAELNKLRSALDAGELGAEGFQTALRLSGAAASEVKRIVFAHPPRED